MTGQLIFAGMLARRTVFYAQGRPLELRSLPALAITAHGTVDKKEIQDDPSDSLWPSETVCDVGCPPNSSSSASQVNTAESLRCRLLARGLSQVDCKEILIAGQLSFPLPATSSKDSGKSTLHRIHNHLIDPSPMLAMPIAVFRN